MLMNFEEKSNKLLTFILKNIASDGEETNAGVFDLFLSSLNLIVNKPICIN